MTDKYNLTNNYKKEFDSNGVLALSVWKYLTFGIFLFQLSMCRIFVTIIKGDLLIASVIVIIAEFSIITFYKNFHFPQIKDLMINTSGEVDASSGRLEDQELAKTKMETIRSKYNHEFEKYDRRKKAQQTARQIKR